MSLTSFLLGRRLANREAEARKIGAFEGVPAMGLDVPASEQPMREHVSEFISHAFYGLATELVRRVVRRRLSPAPAEG